MTRRHSLPAEQLDRLNQRFARERAALVALEKTRAEVREAEQKLTAAQKTFEEAQGRERYAYKTIVKLVGAAGAAELAGAPSSNSLPRSRNGERAATVDGDAPDVS